jgi:hypothetical protein
VRGILLTLAFALAAACGPQPETPRPDPAPPAPPAAASAASASTVPADRPAAAATAPAFPLRVSGTGFVDSAGQPFEWRGVTAFRLAEMLASGREAEVVAYLDWAAAKHLNVVRVLLMAHHLFRLAPDGGVRALPRLLDLAKARGIAVEAVALADTQEIPVDFDAHVREIGRIALEKGNAFVELANEPGHATQDRRLHDPAELRRLAALLPDAVVVALGSAEYADGYAAADYATFHFPREGEWGHVLALADGAGMLRRWKKPVINDEPIGAAGAYSEGRRDNLPERFGAAAALSRFLGLGATFHYEGGLQARLPDERETACLDAWMLGLALTAGLPPDRQLLEAASVSDIAAVTGARAVFASTSGQSAAILLVEPSHTAQVTWRDGWRELRRTSAPGTQLITGGR